MPTRTLTNPTRKERQIAEVRPGPAAERKYLQKLRAAIEAMDNSTRVLTLRLYAKALKANREAGTILDAELAEDATPFGDQRELFGELAKLREKWARYFKKRAREMATDLVQAAYTANKTAWQQRVKKEGFDIPMQLTAAQRTILDVKVVDNVSLIRSIPEQYFQKIEGDVSRGFLAGRDLDAISKALQKTGHATRNRAALIARDQSNKLTAQMNAARQGELGIRYAGWKHSTVAKDPRPNHLRASRESWLFDTQVGIDFGDGAGFVLPGFAVYCRCGSRSVIPGIDEDIGPDDLEPVPGFPGAFKRKAKQSV